MQSYSSSKLESAFLSRYSTRSSEQFPDPFMDMASMAMPESIKDALQWCEFVASANGVYREAINRLASYFITEVEIVGEDISRDEKQKYIDCLHNELKIQKLTRSADIDFLVYGNRFSSLLAGFKRYLMCPKCGLEHPFRVVQSHNEFHYAWNSASFDFMASCPRCQFRGAWKHIDRRSTELKDLTLTAWNVHEMELLHEPVRGLTGYVWKIPEQLRQDIRQGKPFLLERTNWEIIEAIKGNSNLRFDDDVIHHMREDALCGMRNRGWGISRILANFRMAWYVQVLHRYNEALALDYIIPFRLITPAAKGGVDPMSGDPVFTTDLGVFRAQTEAMLRARRHDPARWNVLPFPVEYQTLGGEAQALAPKELLELGRNDLLSATGIPIELWTGSLSTQTFYPAMRLFEANMIWLVQANNDLLNHICARLAQIKNWQPVRARWRSTTLADDIQRQMAKLQLMTSRMVSMTSGLKSVGLDFDEEQRRISEEEKIMAENQAKMQEQMEQQATMDLMAQPMDPAAAGAMPGAPAGGGAPPAAGGAPQAAPGQPMPASVGAMQYTWMQYLPSGSQPISLDEMYAKANLIAQDLMAKPEGQKDSELIALKKQNSAIHALVRSLMDDMRRQAQVQGGAQMLDQQFPKTGAAAMFGVGAMYSA